MKRLLAVLVMVCATAYAETYFVLVDPGTESVLFQVGTDENLQQRLAPGSTFKIPLSLMGFDAGILIDEENPTWSCCEPDEERAVCRQALNPSSWVANSCIWYSQELTRRLGMERLQGYVDAFGYGNQDLTGNPGLNDGLTQAWLSSSLEISCVEQVQFLRKMLDGQLPVSDYALAVTRNILWIEELGNGWDLYGKTGLSFERNEDGTLDKERWLAWFVGWAEKDDRRFLFALNLRELTAVPTMASRWQLAKGYLAQAGVLSVE